MNLSAQKGFAPIFLILGFLIALVGMGGFYYLNQTTLPIPKESLVNTVKPSQLAEGQETTVSGSVIKNYVEGLPVDAPAVLTIQIDDGKVEVEYHPGDAECKNTQAGDLGLTIKKGETVEVFGKFSLGRIRICDSTQYYIHKLNSSIPDPSANWKTYTDSKNMFSVQYPLSLYIKEGLEQTFLVKENASQAEQLGLSDRLVEINVNKNTKRFNAYYNTTDGAIVTDYGDLKLRSYTIGGYKVVEYGFDEFKKQNEIKENEEALRSGASVSMVTFKKGLIFNKEGTIIEVSTDSYYEEFKNTFDQILSTFQFLDQKQTNLEENAGITAGEARKILPLQPSRVSVNKAGNIRTIKWPGTGRGDGYYTVYRKVDSDKNWVKLSQVDVKGDDRGEYEYADTNSTDEVIYIYGVSITNSLGTESIITASNPL